MRKNCFFSILLLAVMVTMGSCYRFEPIAPDNSEAPMPTHTIAQFIEEYGSFEGDLFPVRPNSGDAGLYSIDTIPANGDDIIIVGRVVSDDNEGNIYKYIVLQDLQDPNIGLKVSIDASGISALYPMGQVVTVRCNGMALGKYADMYQLGTVYFNNNEAAAKRGYEPGRMPLALWSQNAHCNGLPDIHAIKIDTLTIADLQDVGNDRSMHSRLICIRHAWFNQKSQGKALDASEKIFAPGTNGIGYPQSRDIEDGTGGYVSIATSEYARFAGVTIPTEEYHGDIVAIVSWYRDKSQYNGNVQLVLRGMSDLHLISQDDGTPWVPVYPF
ncbi:MAG: DUF5689 domain-containing protein [Paludibacteraceae bacterium]|nr:DUF5689 domain-containing protein [Paludibacteraceae bacterium]